MTSPESSATLHSHQYGRYHLPTSMRLQFPPERTPSPLDQSMMRQEFPTEPEDLPSSRCDTVTGLNLDGAQSATRRSAFVGTDTSDGAQNLTSGTLIPPPPGRLSKPGAGGYKLFDVLSRHGWTRLMYQDAQSKSRRLARKHFNMTLGYPSQDKDSVIYFLESAQQAIPLLRNFKDAWPARDFATMYLTNASAEFRRRKKVAMKLDKSVKQLSQD